MALDIKICGLRTEAAVAAAAARGATHVGFIHFPRSPRHLSLDEMAALRPAIPAPVKLVVVLVDPDDALVEAVANRVRPDILQLHGKESPERVAAVKALSGLPVMKALSVGAAADLLAVPRYAGAADRILLDAKQPKGSDLPGGNGVAFDWDLLAGLDPAQPYILSGGLNPGNVAAVLARLEPAGIDLSSGVESAPGVKDLRLIHALFDAIGAASPIERTVS
ncbi:N-(5'-phosphoribosyl)anthranilate isomerase [Aureimonas endophytica]|uniref:N-(5'-phosphoribosyl)anthranilate isomerase n=1 Tax=Aureimonas endophytica TaxID=2027858 RepID=A0A917A1Z2_9HYPH|nr:phosphoribosylanthranilate isomerase [Aureimonas endophytica]GGE21576.1 N-(5'-phosphoribosyl)anthranilate isomerase [Aureimonas endophytica]